jgi:hypothetical protein
VLRAGIAARDARREEVAAGLQAEDGVERLARLLEVWAVGVVVEGGEVGEDVLPAAVVVDAAGGIEDPDVVSFSPSSQET